MEISHSQHDWVIHDLNAELEESCKILCDKYSSLVDVVHNSKKETSRYKTIVTGVLSSIVDQQSGKQQWTLPSTNNIINSNSQCLSCVSLSKELSTASEERENLEYMKPYTQELVTKNQILKTRVRGLETEVSELNRRLTDANRKRELYYSAVDRMETSVTVMSKQLQNVLDHLRLLNTKHSGEDDTNNQ